MAVTSSSGISPGAASPSTDVKVRLEHMSGLDGLRGLAVLAVVVYHFEPSWLPGGFIGVDIFFVLSGFLISSLLLRERIGNGSIDVARFFIRRLRRLMPAVLVLLAALSVYAITWADPVELSRLRRHGLATLAYVSNWVFITDGTTYTDILAGASPLRHVWSLAIEEQLYLVLAVGVLAVAAVGSPSRLRHRFGVLAAVVALASAGWMAWLSVAGASTERTYFGTDTRAHAMLVGAVIGAVLLGRPTADSRLVRWGGRTGLAVLVAVALYGAEDALWLHRGGFLVVALAAGALVVAGASDPVMRRWLSGRPLVAVGAVSYGLYLWHWPVLVIFDQQRTGLDGVTLTLFRLAISAAAATLSYVAVERPIRAGAIGRRWGRRAAVPAVAAMACVVALLVQATVVPPFDEGPVAAVDGSPAPPAARPEVPGAEPDGAQSDTVAGTADVGAPPAVAVPPAAPRRLAVLGDSVVHTIIGGEVSAVGMQFSPWTPDRTTFDPQLVEVTSIAKPGCSFLPQEIAILEPNGSYSHASMERFCDDWRTELAAALGSTDLLMVHLSNDLEDRWIDGDLFPFGTPEYFELLGDLLDELYASTSAAGVAMLLVASAPRARPTWSDDVGDRERQVAAFYRQWAAPRDDVTTVDLGELVCPDGTCPEGAGDLGWRWDGRHYTRAGAVAVADWLTPTIMAAAASTS